MKGPRLRLSNQKIVSFQYLVWKSAYPSQALKRKWWVSNTGQPCDLFLDCGVLIILHIQIHRPIQIPSTPLYYSVHPSKTHFIHVAVLGPKEYQLRLPFSVTTKFDYISNVWSCLLSINVSARKSDTNISSRHYDCEYAG
jgi:hypothetical protein